MKPPFQMLLDSSCSQSKKNFPFNSNSDFTIQLPQRLNFQKDWIVCLKSIHLSNEINNIHDCWGQVGDHFFKLEDGYVTSWSTVLNKLNDECANKVGLSLNRGMTIVIRDLAQHWDSLINRYRYEEGPPEDVPPLVLKLSNNLCHLLGFAIHEDGFKEFIFDKPQEFTLHQSSFNVNLFSLQPRQFVVCVDFVEHSVMGGQQVQMLKYFVVPEMEQNNKRLDVDFNMNDYKKLSNKDFDRIHIRILSAADGQLLKSNPHSPTLLQLLFVNTGTGSSM